jgi:hypothetical protein
MVLFSEASRTLHHGMVIEAATIAEFDVIADNSERANGYILPELRCRRNERSRVDLAHRG